MQKLRGFVQEGMSEKPLDRTEVRTRDLLVDGQAYSQYHDPMALTARNIWREVEAYESFGASTNNLDGLRVEVPRL